MIVAQALHAATGSAAELLDVALDRGTIEAGLRADLVVVEGSALELDTLRERVRAVYQDGRLVAGSSPAAATAAEEAGSSAG